MSATNETFLSSENLEKRWNILPQQMYKLRKSGAIPYVKLSHRVIRYRMSDIVEMEERNLVGSLAGGEQ